jgi:hypothetical protein
MAGVVVIGGREDAGESLSMCRCVRHGTPDLPDWARQRYGVMLNVRRVGPPPTLSKLTGTTENWRPSPSIIVNRSKANQSAWSGTSMAPHVGASSGPNEHTSVASKHSPWYSCALAFNGLPRIFGRRHECRLLLHGCKPAQGAVLQSWHSPAGGSFCSSASGRQQTPSRVTWRAMSATVWTARRLDTSRAEDIVILTQVAQQAATVRRGAGVIPAAAG